MPVLILVAIAVPSIRLLAHQYDPPRADLTVKVTGNQWYWSYEYPDMGINFDSNILPDDQARRARRAPPARGRQSHGGPGRRGGEGDHHLQRRHPCFGVPAFWIKIDAVPGRLNETWFRADRPGVYYGVCYELCGARHGYMPIAVEVVSRERVRPVGRLARRPHAGRAGRAGAGSGRAAGDRRRDRRHRIHPGSLERRRCDGDAGHHESRRDQIRRQRQT